MTGFRRVSDIASSALAIRVPQGLYVLRYATCDGRGSPPRVVIEAPDPAQAELLLPPGMQEPELLAPGDGLIIAASTDIDIRYVVEADCDAVLMLQPVSRLARPQRLERARPRLGSARRGIDLAPPYLPLVGGRRRQASAAAPAAGDGLIILGHVAHRGDISAVAGEWLGSPTGDQAIEGLELRWPNAPRGFDMALRLTVNDHGRRQLPEAGLGIFSGTRRRAAPVVGIDIALEGRRPDGWLIDCEAAFAGQDVLTARGARIALNGKTGREPLVGLRIRIGDEDALHEKEMGALAAIAAGDGAKAARVRIFRPPA